MSPFCQVVLGSTRYNLGLIFFKSYNLSAYEPTRCGHVWVFLELEAGCQTTSPSHQIEVWHFDYRQRIARLSSASYSELLKVLHLVRKSEAINC